MPGSDDDDDPGRPPPHPMDRTWIHPSELGSARPATAASTAPGAPGRRSWRREAALAVTAGAIGALAAVLVLAAVGGFDGDPRPAAHTTSVPVSTDAAAIATRVAPGIAAIAVTAAAGLESRGSGIVVGTHELLTTREVVGAADSNGTIRVSVVSGRAHRATIGAADAVTGLVLLEVPGLRMQPAVLGQSSEVRAGDWVVAVGRTAMSGPWVTSGVVTATHGWTQDPDGVAHAGLINTSTAVSDEARGGALVDGRGHIVGILAMTGSGAPRAAAMPADMADDVAAQLRATGKATHGALGIRAQDASPGPAVTEVVPGSSAARAGVRVDDRILALDQTATPDTATLVYELRRRQSGARTQITLLRGKHRMVVWATLDDATATTTTTTTPGGNAPLALAVHPRG